MHRLTMFSWRWFCRIFFWSGIAPLWLWIKRLQCKDSWTVLAYHRVGMKDVGGGPDSINIKRFRSQIRYLARRYQILPVGEALNHLRSGTNGTKPLLSITFDDGYLDNVTQALPVLLQEGCRATLYVLVGGVTDGQPPWPHRLAIALGTIQAEVEAGPECHADLHPLLKSFVAGGERSAAKLEERIKELVRLAKRMDDEERRGLCEQTLALSGKRGERCAEMIGLEDLVRWQEAGMEVGSHTLRHGILSRQKKAQRYADLVESKEWLERKLGHSVEHLAYPNGRSADFDAESIKDVVRAGYHSAVTTIEGINHRDQDIFTLSRISVAGEPLSAFAIRVSGVMISLRRKVRNWLTNGWVAGRMRKGALNASENTRSFSVAFIGGRGVGGAYSGIERYYEEMGSRMAGRGHTVIAYCRCFFTPKTNKYKGIEVRRLPTIRSKHLETLIHTLLATLDVCFRKIDIVQFHALGSAPFAWIPRMFGKRSVVSVRGLDWQRAKWGWVARTYLRLCEYAALNFPNATVVVSRTQERYFQQKYGRTVRYIPNGVCRRELLTAQGIPRWGLKPKSYLLYAGRLSPEKGLDVLIEAHKCLAQTCPLVIAGGSSYSDNYVGILKKMAGPVVCFTGFQTGDLLQSLYVNAFAFVLPSQMEGMSVALLEAMAYGLPVVASDIPENRELVEQCGGYLFKLGAPKYLSDVLRSALEDRKGAMEIGRQAAHNVRQRFDWEAVVAETEDLYLRLIPPIDRGRTHLLVDPSA